MNRINKQWKPLGDLLKRSGFDEMSITQCKASFYNGALAAITIFENVAEEDVTREEFEAVFRSMKAEIEGYCVSLDLEYGDA